MIKVGKFLEIRRFLGDFFDFFAFVDFFCGGFWEQLGALGATRIFWGGDFGSTRSNSEHSDFGGDGGDWGLVGAGVSQLL